MVRAKPRSDDRGNLAKTMFCVCADGKTLSALALLLLIKDQKKKKKTQVLVNPQLTSAVSGSSGSSRGGVKVLLGSVGCRR